MLKNNKSNAGLVTAVAHNCFCERIESHVMARFTDMRLSGSIKIMVQEDLKIKLPLKSDCECHPKGKVPRRDGGYMKYSDDDDSDVSV